MPLQEDIRAGQFDLALACSQSLAHGVLLALRYLTPLVPWQDASAAPGQFVHVRAYLQGLLGLLDQATDLALPCLANPQDSNIGLALTPSKINCVRQSGHEHCRPARPQSSLHMAQGLMQLLRQILTWHLDPGITKARAHLTTDSREKTKLKAAGRAEDQSCSSIGACMSIQGMWLTVSLQADHGS